MTARAVKKSPQSPRKSADKAVTTAAPAAIRSDAEQVARRARKAGKRAASKVASAVSSTAKKVAEAVSSTAQRVAEAAKGVAKRVAAATTPAVPVPAPAAPVKAGTKARAKKAAKKAGPAKAAAKQAAKSAAPAKAAAKKAAKSAAPAKAAAKKAAKAAGPAKAAAKKAAKAAKTAVVPAKASAKKAAKVPANAAPTAALTGPLADWLARLNTSIASLQADPRIDVVVNWQAPGATLAQLDAVEAKLGLKLGPAIRNLYQQADGLALVWGPKGECPPVLRGRPKMMYIEGLGGARGAIYFPPIGEVFGVRGRPTFDYAQFMAGAPAHWGFDFPGNFYTPAFVRVGDGLQVRVGDDHGAAWDGPTVSFERYLENVLATWGSIDERVKHFVKGKGKPVAAVPLVRLLA